MTTITPSRSARLSPIVQVARSPKELSPGVRLAGRLIQMVLAVYLLPAFLVVLMVGGVGILIHKISQVLTGLIIRSRD